MADNYTNATGLGYFWNRIKTVFVNKESLTESLDTKVDKVSGMGLSTNDYTSSEKLKLEGIESSAEVNLISSITANNVSLPITNKTVNVSIPTNNNELTNGAGYRTEAQVNAAIASSIGEMTGFEFVIVEELPVTGQVGKLYLIPAGSTTANVYDEYAWINDAWEKLGTTAIDLTDYWNATNLSPITTEQIDAITV